MNEALELPPLRGRNPRAFFAALGALDVATRALPDIPVTLAWTEATEPVAVLQGPHDREHLIELCDRDRQRWARSPVLNWPDDAPVADLKVPPESVHGWLGTALESGGRIDADLLGALLAEGPVSGKNDSKPTQLHFTAGQQKFLSMVRRLRDASDADALRETLCGPWRYASKLGGLGWQAGGEQSHAYSRIAPADLVRGGVPGADWLGFLGLRFFPVVADGERLATTGCSGRWKHEQLMWPLWSVPAPARVVGSLIGRGDLAALTFADRRALGVHRLLRAPIRRSDQGGYGSFGAADEVVPEASRAK